MFVLIYEQWFFECVSPSKNVLSPLTPCAQLRSLASRAGVVVAYGSGRFCTISTCVAGVTVWLGSVLDATDDATAEIRPPKRARTPSSPGTPFIPYMTEVYEIY